MIELCGADGVVRDTMEHEEDDVDVDVDEIMMENVVDDVDGM